MERDTEYYQHKIDLTLAQKKAWIQLVKAINKCKKEKIRFYQLQELLIGLNGLNVIAVGTDLDMGTDNPNLPQCLQYKNYQSIETAHSGADDNHFVLLKGEFWPGI